MIALLIYASFRTHKKYYTTAIYLNFAEGTTSKLILMLADKRLLGVWYKQVQVITMLIGYKQSTQILYKP